MKSKTNTNKDVYARILEQIMTGLDNGVAVWSKSWTPAMDKGFSNPLSGFSYRGQNVWLLAWAMMLSGWDSPYFATYKQIQESGGQVIKGSKGISLVKWFPYTETPKQAAERLNVPVAQVKKTDCETVGLKCSWFTVFNLKAQTTGLDELIPVTEPEKVVNSIQECENILAGYADEPDIMTGNLAAYSPDRDTIILPAMTQFNKPESYYATRFHEDVHSTGHVSRLNRDLSGKFGSKKYASEELVAELGAAFLCGRARIETKTIENHTAYIQSWKKLLTDEPDILFKAMTEARKAVEYMTGSDVFFDGDDN